jgi:hypothetical protein
LNRAAEFCWRKTAEAGVKAPSWKSCAHFLAAAAAAIFVALLALSTIFTLATNRGTLEIRTVDEDVEVVILRNGKKVKALDTKTFAREN